MVRKGLVTRSPDPADRRSSVVYLTGRGREMKEVLIPLDREVLDRATRGMTAEQVAELKLLLNQMFRNLEQFFAPARLP